MNNEHGEELGRNSMVGEEDGNLLSFRPTIDVVDDEEVNDNTAGAGSN